MVWHHSTGCRLPFPSSEVAPGLALYWISPLASFWVGSQSPVNYYKQVNYAPKQRLSRQWLKCRPALRNGAILDVQLSLKERFWFAGVSPSRISAQGTHFALPRCTHLRPETLPWLPPPGGSPDLQLQKCISCTEPCGSLPWRQCLQHGDRRGGVLSPLDHPLCPPGFGPGSDQPREAKGRPIPNQHLVGSSAALLSGLAAAGGCWKGGRPRDEAAQPTATGKPPTRAGTHSPDVHGNLWFWLPQRTRAR